MDATGEVECVNALGELAERGPQAQQVGEGARGITVGSRRAAEEAEIGVRAPSGPARGVVWDRGVLGAAPREEVHPLDQLHGHQPALLGVEELVELHEVGVVQVGEGPELLLEPVEARAVRLPQGLEGHHATIPLVANLVDHAGAALAERLEHGEALGARERSAGETAARGAEEGGVGWKGVQDCRGGMGRPANVPPSGHGPRAAG